MRRSGGSMCQAGRTTKLTSLPGTTITLTTSWPSRCAARVRRARASASSSSRDAPAGACDAVADLAVDLADELERVAPRGTRGRPPATAAPRRARRSAGGRRRSRRAGANGNSSEAAVASAKRTAPGRRLAALGRRDLVEQLHHRGDRGVEGEAPGHVGRDLVDRPVRLAQEPLVVGVRACGRGPASSGSSSAASALRRHSRPRKRCMPSTPLSDQSASWSGGPMKRM